MSRRPLLLLLVLCTVLAARHASAQQTSRNPLDRPTVTAIRLEASETITLDGQLDESAWQRAVPAKDFVQQIPVNGSEPTERTEVRFLYTSDALYMGVTCYDDEPEKMLGNTIKPIPVDESILAFLEPKKRLDFIKQWRTAAGR